jgi:hypothetical protein
VIVHNHNEDSNPIRIEDSELWQLCGVLHVVQLGVRHQNREVEEQCPPVGVDDHQRLAYDSRSVGTCVWDNNSPVPPI